MRPKMLRFAGIGPFRHEEVIDFEHLDAAGLYLIVGPTGAGKTTIFEAMTYALFAKVPSDRDLRSTFPHEKSFIEFVFSHNGSDHRVMRDHTRDNGDFYEQLPKGARVAQRRDVTQHIENLLKLTADQFMKIVLLPQGQFQEFLIANTTEKEAILQRIFGTEIYKKVAEQVSTYAQELATELQRIENALQVEMLAVANDVRSLRTSYPDLGIPDDDTAFEEAKRIISEAIPEAKRVSGEAQALVQQLSGDLAQAKDLVTLFDDDKLLSTLRAEAERDADAVKDATAAVDAHQRAERALRMKSELDKAVTERTSILEQRDIVLRDLRREAGRLKLDIPQVSTFRSSIETSHNLPEEFGKLSQAAGAALDTLDHIDSLQEELNDARSMAVDLKNQINEADDAIVSLEADRAGLGKQRTAANSQVAGLASLQRKVDKLDEQLEKADVRQAKKDVATATQRLLAARRALAAAEKALASAQHSHEIHLAGQLAKHLQDDHNCPVCGSKDHPKPARAARKVDLQSHIDRHAAAKAKVSGAERDLRTAEGSLEAAKRADSKLPSAAAQSKMREQLKQAKRAARMRDAIEKQFDSAVGDLADARESRTSSLAELRGTEASIKRLTDDLKRISANAPKALSDAQRRETTQALSRLEDLSAKKHKSDTSLQRLTTRIGTLETSITNSLQKEGFRTIDAALSAQLTDQSLSKKTSLLEIAKKRDTKVIELAARVKGRTVPKERPDTANIEAELRRNQTAQGVAATRLTKLSSLNHRIEEFDVHHAKLRPQAEEAQSRLLEANHLEKAMNTGQGVGVGRVYRLQEWIQRRLFEQVCRVASEQLRVLTEGRYIITLKADAGAVVRRSQGLDLYVVDSHQGTKRGVGTLSGGETFLASLALALALAEVVQTHAGGIKLPCLFIDEGFGSLDRETLSCATEVLKTLQGSGRTIGVITHVDAMHEDLHPGIRVIKTDSGSRLEFPLKQ